MSVPAVVNVRNVMLLVLVKQQEQYVELLVVPKVKHVITTNVKERSQPVILENILRIINVKPVRRDPIAVMVKRPFVRTINIRPLAPVNALNVKVLSMRIIPNVLSAVQDFIGKIILVPHVKGM